MKSLRELKKGTWKKVYNDGKVSGKNKSVHYFEHSSGTAYQIKVKNGHSN